MTDEKVTLDFESLTYQELADIEQHCGRPFAQVLSDLGRGPVKDTAVLSWVIHRRTDPELTLDDVMGRAAVPDIGSIEFTVSEPDPTEPAA
jgi:hypothetical protein